MKLKLSTDQIAKIYTAISKAVFVSTVFQDGGGVDAFHLDGQSIHKMMNGEEIELPQMGDRQVCERSVRIVRDGKQETILQLIPPPSEN